MTRELGLVGKKKERVLVRNVGLKGKNKLADKWYSDVYGIKDIPNSDIPVFMVQSTISRKTRTLNRNILPFNHVPPCDSDLPVVSRTPVSRRKIIEKHISDLQESDSSDPEIIQIKTRTIRTNQNYSVDSYSSSNANEHDFALFQNEFQSSENIGDGTGEAFGNTIQRILYLLVVDRISQFHRLCREGLQDLQSYNTIQELVS